MIVCRVRAEELATIGRRLRKLGIANRVHFPGFVDDADLVRLYQACELFVFPPLYEGFGLPIAEAIACGAPVISSDTSSLPELVTDPDALFDPREPEAIRAALERSLLDEGFRRRLAEVELDERHTWAGVAARTAAVYQELLSKPARRRPRRRRIAFASPLPPARSGIAGVSHALLGELVADWEIDAFADQDEAEVPHGVHFEHIHCFDVAERARGGYDRVVVCLGNSEHHAEALSLLRRRPAVVIAHDVRLAGLYAWTAANRPELEPRGLQGALREMYGARLPATVGASGWLDVADYERYGVLMAREAIACSERYLVHSEYAADLARLDAARRDAGKIGVLPFGVTPPAGLDGAAPSNGRPLVASFGVVGPAKQPEKLIEAFAIVRAREPSTALLFAGPVEQAQERPLRDLAEKLGLADSIRFTGELGEADFARAMRDTSVAVQLRTVSNGETSAAVMECLAAGLPTIVSAIGSARELPDDAVVKIPRDDPPEALAAAVAALLADADARTALGAAGRRYAEGHSFAWVAEELGRELSRS